MAVVQINQQNFHLIEESGRPVLLDFYADWCGPCRMMAPVVEQIANERSDILVGKVNVDEEPELAQRFGVFSIPTIVALKDGAVVDQSVGARPKEQILALLQGKYAYKLTAERGFEKVYAALVRKGFSYSAVRQAMKKYNSDLEFEEQ